MKPLLLGLHRERGRSYLVDVLLDGSLIPDEVEDEDAYLAAQGDRVARELGPAASEVQDVEFD